MSISLSLNPASSSPPYGGVVRRAVLVSLILGSVLTVTNQSAAVFGDQPLQLVPLAVNFATPFIVVAVSQLLAIRVALSAKSIFAETVVQTALRHNIPRRATAVALGVGLLNALILGASGGVDSLSPMLLSQIFGLPFAFGILSQTLSFRRVAVNI